MSDDGILKEMIVQQGDCRHGSDAQQCRLDLLDHIMIAVAVLGDSLSIAGREHHNDAEYQQSKNQYKEGFIYLFSDQFEIPFFTRLRHLRSLLLRLRFLCGNVSGLVGQNAFNIFVQ